MVIIYFTERGMVTGFHMVKNPETKNMESIVNSLVHFKKKGEKYYFGFENVNPREQGVWYMAEELAEQRLRNKFLEKIISIYRKKLSDLTARQIPCYYPSSLTRKYARDIQKTNCKAKILDNDVIKLFDGDDVMEVPTSDKEDKDILIKKR